MSYTCRVYSNTGFNAVNIPDSPALLDQLPYIDHPALEVFQDRNLDHIDIKVASYDQIKNADYVNLGDWFYFVDGIFMLSGDTCRLSLLPDFITSIGGISYIEVLDGITQRVHVDSDDYGEWCEADPFMAPAEPLEEVHHLFTGREAQGVPVQNVVVKSTLDLETMASGTNDRAIAYSDTPGQQGGAEVVVPQVDVNPTGTETTYGVVGWNGDLPIESHTTLYDATNQQTQIGLGKVNSLGVNGAVTAQVAFPDNFVNVDYVSGHPSKISRITGRNFHEVCNELPFVIDNNVQNMRINYSEYTPFGIITASGASEQYMPADIRLNVVGDHPLIKCIADPRTDGKPYYRYDSYRGDNSDEGFFKNALGGLPWRQVPLVYEGSQGKYFQQLSHDQASITALREFNYSMEDLKWEQGGKTVHVGGFDGDGSDVRREGPGQYLSLFKNLLNAPGWIANDIEKEMRRDSNGYTLDQSRLRERYANERAFELQSYLANTNIYTPVVQFPFSADLYNDLYYNPCYCYRLVYRPNDIARIDKILTMYGYKVTKPLETSDFTNRQYFNYVQSSISVGGNLPRWICNGIAIQLQNGVRIWHTVPSRTYYNSNPIV